MRLMSAGLVALLVLALVGCGSKRYVVAEVEGEGLERVEGATLGREVVEVEWWGSPPPLLSMPLRGEKSEKERSTPPAVRGGWSVVREQGQAEVVERVARAEQRVNVQEEQQALPPPQGGVLGGAVALVQWLVVLVVAVVLAQLLPKRAGRR